MPATERSATGYRRNIFPGTATSDIWNVTYRPSLTTFAPILISFSRKLVCDQGCTVSLRADFFSQAAYCAICHNPRYRTFAARGVSKVKTSGKFARLFMIKGLRLP